MNTSKDKQLNFIVSVVVIKNTKTGFNTQNKLYTINTISAEEAKGKALSLIKEDFPDHRLHTICHIQIK